MLGITGFGAYLPRARLQRKAIADANAWFDSSLRDMAKGERTMCNWDEDVNTMAVEAARDCLGGRDRSRVRSLLLASTSAPFLQRQNSVVVGEALDLRRDIRTMDVSGSLRAGTTAFLAALEQTGSVLRGAPAGADEILVVASEHQRSKCGSVQEMLYGDAAVAMTLGTEGVLAEFLCAHSTSVDFVDSYRSDGFRFDVRSEERWIRDEGYMKLVPEAATALLQQAGVAAASVQRFILPAPDARTAAAVAKKIGIGKDAVADSLLVTCGIAGAAHALLMLAHSLETAKPGDLLLVIGFGQGCDAVLLRATDRLETFKPRQGVSGALRSRRPEENYQRFSSFNGLSEHDMGKRSEVDKITYVSAMYRSRKLLNSFAGGMCKACGTVQVPKTRYCVNPACTAVDSQADYGLADSGARVVTWTADALTFDFDPPAYFGLIEFAEGARLMIDFTEVDPGRMQNDAPVTMHFRVRQIDDRRGFRRYFWKARLAD